MGKVIGSVTLSRRLEEIAGGRLLIVVPENRDALIGEGSGVSDPVVVYDEISAGQGDRVAFSEGREAAMPFHPRSVPVDAYCAAIIDKVNINARTSEGG